MARNFCLFAHFDAHARVAPYVFHYLNAIRSCGFEIIFISTAGIADVDVGALNRVCYDVIRRPNIGFDFESWAMGYTKHERNFDGELLLANDSVYGPIGSLDAAIVRLRSMAGDIRGMVESMEHERHVQSWFVLLSPHVHRSTPFREVLMQGFANLSKTAIIDRGEIGLSSRLYRAGFTSAALFPGRPRAMGNPSHILWKELIEIFGVPFIKIELLRDNPSLVSNLSYWREVVGATAPALVAMIEEHIAHSGRRWAEADATLGHRAFLSPASFWRRDFLLDFTDRRMARELNRCTFRGASAAAHVIKRIRSVLGRLIRRTFRIACASPHVIRRFRSVLGRQNGQGAGENSPPETL